MLLLSKWQNVIDKMVSEIEFFFLPLCLLSNSPKNLYWAPILSAESKIIMFTVMMSCKMSNMGISNSLEVYKINNECTNAFKSAYPQKKKM